MKCFSSLLPSPLEVWGETCEAEILLQICLRYISCPWEMCTQLPVKIQAFFVLPKAQGTVPASEIQAEAQLFTSPQACHLFARCGIVHFALGSWDQQLPNGWPIWQSQRGLCSAPRGSSPLPLLRLKILSLLCPCGASCAWTTVLLNGAPLALHNLLDSLQVNDMMLHVT